MLANVIRKELEQIFCQFDPKLEAADEVRCFFIRSVWRGQHSRQFSVVLVMFTMKTALSAAMPSFLV